MNREETHIDLANLTVKKLTKSASNSELDQLEALMSKSVENRKSFDDIVKTWDGVESARGLSQKAVDKEWNRLSKSIRQETTAEKPFSFYRIAATVALLIVGSLAAYFFIQNSNQTEIIASQIQTKTLGDGSSVTLNAKSMLSYAKDFNIEKREVVLTGEAFFDVKSNKAKPFVIHAQGLDITVVGTLFNVKVNEKSNVFEVVVTSGVVKLTQGSKSILLEAGEKGTLIRKSGKFFKSKNDNPNFESWRTKHFVFDDQPLSSVIQALNEVYGKSMYLASSQLKNCPITVSFEDQSFESIINILKTTLNLSMKETSKGLLISSEGC